MKKIFAQTMTIFTLICLAPVNKASELARTINRISRNDPTLTELKLYNFGEPADKALKQVFSALANNTKVKKLLISNQYGFGKKETWGVHLTNTSLLKDISPKKGIIKHLKISSSAIASMIRALEVNSSLELIHLHQITLEATNIQKNALGTAISAHPSLKHIILADIWEIDSKLINSCLRNPHLITLDLEKLVNITIPEEDFMNEFGTLAFNHTTLEKLRLVDSSLLGGHITGYDDDNKLTLLSLIERLQQGQGPIKEIHLPGFGNGLFTRQNN